MIPARCRERAIIVQVSAVRRHRSRNVGHGHGFFISAAPSSSALWQFPPGMASVLYSFACRRSHSAALRFTSFVYASVHPCPGNLEKDARTYRNPSPRPSPAIKSWKESRSHAYCSFYASRRCSLRSRLSLSASVQLLPNQDGTSPPKMTATLRRRHLPRRILPRSGSRLIAAIRPLLPGKQPPHPSVGHGSCRAASRQLSPTSPPTHPIIY